MPFAPGMLARLILAIITMIARTNKANTTDVDATLLLFFISLLLSLTFCLGTRSADACVNANRGVDW
jgi:hypothetical protein